MDSQGRSPAPRSADRGSLELLWRRCRSGRPWDVRTQIQRLRPVRSRSGLPLGVGHARRHPVPRRASVGPGQSIGARVPRAGYSGHRRRDCRGGLRGSPQRALASRSRELGPRRAKACHYLLPASGLLLGVRPNVGGWRSPTGRFGYPVHDQSDHVRPPGTFGGRSGECRRVALAADDGGGPVRSAQRIEARPVPLRRDGVGVMARAPPGDLGPCRRR